MRRRIETTVLLHDGCVLHGLPTNIHEKKDWNTISSSSSSSKRNLTNQYPWEEGLKPFFTKVTFRGRLAYQPISMRRRIETINMQNSRNFKGTYQPISMRRRIETFFSDFFAGPTHGLPTNIHEKKDWNNLLDAINRDDTKPYQPISMRRRIETHVIFEVAGRTFRLTNQYPWEEGLKRITQSVTVQKEDDLTNQYPWEEGLKLTSIRRRWYSPATYQPISMRRRIETCCYEAKFPKINVLPTNIHEKKDWNITRKAWWRKCGANLPTNIHEKKDWNSYLQSHRRMASTTYQPISMRRRIETRRFVCETINAFELTNQYPWEEGLKHSITGQHCQRKNVLPTNIHEKKDWNLVMGGRHSQRAPLTNQYPWEEGLKL